MAGPYRYRPTGPAKIASRFRGLQKQADATRTAANIRNSKITGGSGLTIEDPAGQSIQLLATADNFCQMLFAPPFVDRVNDWVANISFTPDGSYGGGELTFSSPRSPTAFSPTDPLQTAFISLTSGDGVTGAATIGLSVVGVAIELMDASFGNPARIVIGGIGSSAGIEEDATSWRLFAGDASLIFPQGTSEVRIRDVNNAAYTVIRASAFTVTSTREAKQDIRDFGWSPAGAVANAPAFQYRYRDGHADPSRLHFGPMAEDLPAEMVDHTDPDVPAVNAVNMIGVLWGAVGEQQATIAALTARVEALERLSGPGTPEGQ